MCPTVTRDISSLMNEMSQLLETFHINDVSLQLTHNETFQLWTLNEMSLVTVETSIEMSSSVSTVTRDMF